MTRRGSSLMANSMRQQARAAMADLSQPRIYLISAYDGQGSVKVNVTYDPGGTVYESNWMPLGCIGVGNGWGLMVGPQIGDQVLCIFENGDFNSGVVVARLFSSQAQPLAVPSGEIWAVHKTGTSLKFTTNGDCDLNVTGNLNATVTGNIVASATAATITAPTTITGNLSVTGNIAATGSISDVGGAHGSMSSLRAAYDSHTHSGVQTGSGNTGGPSSTV